VGQHPQICTPIIAENHLGFAISAVQAEIQTLNFVYQSSFLFYLTSVR
jgi:hypothetical protein